MSTLKSAFQPYLLATVVLLTSCVAGCSEKSAGNSDSTGSSAKLLVAACESVSPDVCAAFASPAPFMGPRTATNSYGIPAYIYQAALHDVQYGSIFPTVDGYKTSYERLSQNIKSGGYTLILGRVVVPSPGDAKLLMRVELSPDETNLSDSFGWDADAFKKLNLEPLYVTGPTPVTESKPTQMFCKLGQGEVTCSSVNAFFLKNADDILRNASDILGKLDNTESSLANFSIQDFDAHSGGYKNTSELGRYAMLADLHGYFRMLEGIYSKLSPDCQIAMLQNSTSPNCKEMISTITSNPDFVAFVSKINDKTNTNRERLLKVPAAKQMR